MILWCDGAHPPDENMRRDEALLGAIESACLAEREASRPEAVLRLFRFAPYGITLGRSQDPSRALDLDRCHRDGVPWAVRPTGGRAIFHAEEWTYSLAAAIDDPDWGGSLSQAYERAATLILRSLLRLGVPAAFAPRPAVRHASDPSGAACFAATARHEIVLGGRKLVGSAQRRGARALLQQGSVLLGAGHERLADYLGIAETERAAARIGLAAAATHAGDTLGADPPLERWAASLMAELPAATRSFEGEAGARLLTLAEARSYTAHSL
jgi:lipoate-protein ligase A